MDERAVINVGAAALVAALLSLIATLGAGETLPQKPPVSPKPVSCRGPYRVVR
jgi:hypothetical protein